MLCPILAKCCVYNHCCLANPHNSQSTMPIKSVLGRISLSLFAVILLSTIVFANGFREFLSVGWVYEIVSIATFFFALVTLIHRAMKVAHKGWRRAALIASAAGALLVEVMLFDPLGLNASGQVIAFLILTGWGIMAGLLLVEGLRWVESGFLEERGSFTR